MQRNQHALASLIKVLACSIFVLGVVDQVQAQDKKSDPTGTWTWSTPGRDGGPERKSTLKLKLEGDKLTGILTAPGRQGGQSRDTAIEDAKLKVRLGNMTCPKKHPLTVRQSGTRFFLGCENYPTCDYTESLSILEGT